MLISSFCLSTSAVHSASVSAYTKQRRVHVLHSTTTAVCLDCLMRFISYIALQQGFVVPSAKLSHSFGALNLYRFDCVQGVQKFIHNIVLESAS